MYCLYLYNFKWVCLEHAGESSLTKTAASLFQRTLVNLWHCQDNWDFFFILFLRAESIVWSCKFSKLRKISYLFNQFKSREVNNHIWKDKGNSSNHPIKTTPLNSWLILTSLWKMASEEAKQTSLEREFQRCGATTKNALFLALTNHTSVSDEIWRRSSPVDLKNWARSEWSTQFFKYFRLSPSWILQ